MTTFTHTDADGDELSIERDGIGEALLSVSGSNAVYVPKAVAPAVALALLESAGAASVSGAVSQAVVCLRSHLNYAAAEKRREEAAERAEALRAQRARLAREAEEAEKAKAAQDAEEAVDEEALFLLNAYRKAMGMLPISREHCVGYVFDYWRATARAVLNRA